MSIADPAGPALDPVRGSVTTRERPTATEVDRNVYAVQAARRRARRSWRRYAIGMTVFVLAVATFVFSVWRTSEIRAVHDHPTTVKARVLPSGAIPAGVHALWHTADRLAQGQAVYLDVVTTYSQHQVVGRDATTGRVRWTYSRSDRSICSVNQDGATVIAIYRHDGNCDELSALNAESGKRGWTRTQFEDGASTAQPISQFLLQVTPQVVDLTQPGGVDPTQPGGAEYWLYNQSTGCTTINAVVGTTGVLWGSKCASGSTLALRNGSGPDNKTPRFTVALDGRAPLSADAAITVLTSDGRGIQVLSAKTGAVTATIHLSSPVTAPQLPAAVASVKGDAELISTAGSVVAIPATATPTTELWQRATTGVPANTDAGLLFPASGRVAVIDPATGHLDRTISAPGLAADSVLQLRGPGFVSADASGTSAWG